MFSAFSVGLLGNAVLPGRVGEFARVAVIARHLPAGARLWPPVAGSIVAHRLFDVLPMAGLAAYVLVAAKLPKWAVPGVEIVLAVGGVLLVAALVLARRMSSSPGQHTGRVRRLLGMARRGLGVFRAPGPAIVASVCQLLGWALQLAAVWLAFSAFGIDEPIAAAALVLLVVNVALAFPLWPGAVGLFQAAVALALLPYGIGYDHGFAYGIGLQAIETACGVGSACSSWRARALVRRPEGAAGDDGRPDGRGRGRGAGRGLRVDARRARRAGRPGRAGQRASATARAAPGVRRAPRAPAPGLRPLGVARGGPASA
ncbi:MAG: lysylphosphatidylglycerol synthase transmembrane domain-containing protein [Thermoleophilia bacterium]